MSRQAFTTVGQATARPPTVSLIVPTYCEAENLAELIRRVDQVRAQDLPGLEMVIVDDNSDDGTEQVVGGLHHDWVRLIVRRNERGLSSAVLEGIRQARHDIAVVMDADLSHPPEVIAQLVGAIAGGADFVIGSRYVAGGSTEVGWGLFRWLNSRVATWMARPLTRVKDPMSGFFAIRRERVCRARDLDPIGYKIGLELLVRCECRDVREVPIHFADRKAGQSKLSFREQLRYVRHVRRLLIRKYPNLSSISQFLAVGASGVVVNLAALTGLLALRVPKEAAVAAAIAVSMLSNFALNRRFTFSHARGGSWVRQFLAYVGTNSLGAILSYAVTLAILYAWPQVLPQLAALAGVLAGTACNYTLSRFLVFRRRLSHDCGENT